MYIDGQFYIVNKYQNSMHLALLTTLDFNDQVRTQKLKYAQHSIVYPREFRCDCDFRSSKK